MSAKPSIPVSRLECSKAFEALTSDERHYAHYLAQASFQGSLIVLLQTSPESPFIFLLLEKIFSEESVESLRAECTKESAGVSNEEFDRLLEYAASFFNNMGNYKSFGDSKIVPEIPEDKLWIVVSTSKAFAQHKSKVQELWDACHSAIYDMSPRRRELGLGEKGLTTYYSSNCDVDDAELIKKFMQSKSLSPYNTRVFKTVSAEGSVTYELRLASAVSSAECCGEGDDMAAFLGDHSHGECTVHVTRGDYAPLLQLVADSLTAAKEYAANDFERSAISSYTNSFLYGSIPAHKEGSRAWIADKGPVVESYIGFIESYRDPFGVRGEFEGFVAVVNKPMSTKFSKLVESAPSLLPMLPWPSSFEKDTFLKPDFTSLDVVAFGGSGIPAGINIPNYDDIRQTEGFKNVSLGNVLSARTTDDKVTFLRDEDQELFKRLKAPAFEVQVGLHELLGHGSGKLFIKEEDGKFNFDIDTVTHPLTHEKIEGWYGHADTWDTVFSSTAASYEECRAECVGIYLCLDPDILSIFGHEGDDGSDIAYINWLLMVRAGLLALEFYSPETQSWKQAHMQARHAILRVLLEAGEGLVTLEKTEGDDGQADYEVHLDRTKLSTVGKPAIGAFLQKLQVYKTTADFPAGKSLYQNYSGLSGDEQAFWLGMRDVILARKRPRQLFVQGHTVVENGAVQLVDYEASMSGMIQSWVARFSYGCSDDLLRLALADKDQWNY